MSIDLKDRSISIEDRIDAIADRLVALETAPVATGTDDDTAVEARVETLEKEVGTDTAPVVDTTVTADQVATDTTAA